ncbi:MAG TPA: hypothetical protein VHB70_11805, partial [Parafilimonas sp.]|nr:hypothetical protein [Parafilimonas sp.]
MKLIPRRLLLCVILICLINFAHSQSYIFAQLHGDPLDTTGWKFSGAAYIGNVTGTDDTEIIVCPANYFQSGAVFYAEPINLSLCNRWTAEFDFRIFDGTLADGLAFCFLDVPPTNFVNGGGMGIPQTANGLKICFDPNPNCFPLNFAIYPKIEIRWGAGYDECWSQPTVDNSTGSLSFIRSNNYNHAKVVYDNGNISLYVNNTLYITGFQQFNFAGYLGFTASTGAKTDNHSIKNVTIYTDIPPSKAGANQTICSGQSVNIGTSPNAGYVYQWSPTRGLSSSFISNPKLTLTNNGSNEANYTYYVQTSLSGSPGCSSTDSVTITVLPSLPASVSLSGSATNITSGTPITFTAKTVNLQPPLTYQWYKNNQKIGSDSSVYTDDKLNNNDSIWVSVTGSNSCNAVIDTTSNKIVIRVTTNACTGSIGDAIVNETFGSGTGLGLPLSPDITNLDYVATTCPNDGQYTITNYTTDCWNGGWNTLTDHTGDTSGYFMLINASYQPSIFFKKNVSGLCSGTTYKFSSWIMNICKFTSIEPNITLSIEDQNGDTLASYNTG